MSLFLLSLCLLASPLPATPSPLPPSPQPPTWLLTLPTYSSALYSQFGQDGYLARIFAILGTHSSSFVEFGFNVASYEEAQTGSNTRLLWEGGWSGLLMDSEFQNATINLQKHFIYEHNVVDLFQQYNVPLDVDYVSIDIDSTDLWIFRALLNTQTKASESSSIPGGQYYRPRVVTVEYNCVFPFEYPLTCNRDCVWNGDRVYGASLSALR